MVVLVEQVTKSKNGSRLKGHLHCWWLKFRVLKICDQSCEVAVAMVDKGRVKKNMDISIFDPHPPNMDKNKKHLFLGFFNQLGPKFFFEVF